MTALTDKSPFKGIKMFQSRTFLHRGHSWEQVTCNKILLICQSSMNAEIRMVGFRKKSLL